MAIVALRNQISSSRRRYLDSGGLGILVGDGTLPHAGAEQILETYYSLALGAHVAATLDYQWVDHPGYNRDRGPASILALRLHAQF